MKYTIEGHALRRIIQRKIPKEWIPITIENGTQKENYGSKNLIVSSISKDKCQELIDSLTERVNANNIDGKEIPILLEQIDSLQELRDRGGIKVVHDINTNKVVTAYHKKETITAEFRVF